MTLEQELNINKLDIISENIINIVSDAQLAHIKNPTDVAHDWPNHHLPVLKNIVGIIEKEGLINKIDIPAVLCAGAWHDYKRHSGDFSVMEESLKNRGMDNEFCQKVVNIINEHSFGDEKKTLEGFLLWAADKIEYVSKDRYLAAKNGLPKLKTTIYHMIMKKRVPKVISEMENCPFRSATETFKLKYDEFKKYIKLNNIKDLNWFIKLT